MEENIPKEESSTSSQSKKAQLGTFQYQQISDAKRNVTCMMTENGSIAELTSSRPLSPQLP